MMAKLLAGFAGALLLASGLEVATGEAGIWAEYGAYRGVVVARRRIPDAEALAAVALVSRWQVRPPAAVAGRELDTLTQIVDLSSGQPSPDIDRLLATAARKLGSAAPMNGRAWCALSEVALRARTEMAAMQRALARCHATAPFELDVMARRSFQAVLVWPVLSDDLRRATLDDFEKLMRSKSKGTVMAERAARFAATVVPERDRDFASVVSKLGKKTQAVYKNLFNYHTNRPNVNGR